jgi:nicotinamidase-related amidase
MSDAFSKGFDCIMLTDVCGTSSPEYMTDAVIRSVERCWGFVTDSDELARGVEAMFAPS